MPAALSENVSLCLRPTFMLPDVRSITAVAFIALMLFAPSPKAADALRDPAAAYEHYLDEQKASYAAVNARYAAAKESAPDDLRLALAHCEFIDNFTYAEDIQWNQSAEADLQACEEGLATRWPDEPEVRVHQLESQYNNDALTEAEALWQDASDWPPELRARIAAKLYALYDGELASKYASIAAQLGRTELLPEAIRHLAAIGESPEAAAMAAAAPVESTWQMTRRIEALLELEDKAPALTEMRRAGDAGIEVPAVTRVNVHMASGDLEAATAAAGELGDESGNKNVRATRFALAMATGRHQQAGKFISIVEDGFEISAQRYASVIAAAPLTAFGASMLPMTLAMIAVVAFLALLPGLVLIPVHYRGLMRSVRGSLPTPLFERVGLRHAWIACGFFLLVPLLAACVMYPEEVGSIFKDEENAQVFTRFLAVFAGSAVTLVLLVPWLPRLGFGHLLGPVGWKQPWLRTIAIVIGCYLVVLSAGMLSQMVLSLLQQGDTGTAQTRMVSNLIQSSHAEYGVLATLFLIALLVPIVEELVFRGMLLGGLSRNLNFWWANLLQSLIFASIHGDPPRFAVYFLLGLFGGWLVRRTGALWPAIALHALNNAVAVALTLARV